MRIIRASLFLAMAPLQATTYTIQEINLGGTSAEAEAVNASGQVVGQGRPSSGGVDDHGLLFSGGIASDLGTLGGSIAVARRSEQPGERLHGV